MAKVIMKDGKLETIDEGADPATVKAYAEAMAKGIEKLAISIDGRENPTPDMLKYHIEHILSETVESLEGMGYLLDIDVDEETPVVSAG